MTNNIYTYKNRDNIYFIKYNEIYLKILELYNFYNINDMSKILNISTNVLKSIYKKFNLKQNDKFISSKSYNVIKFCKIVLKKDTSITYDDLQLVKNIIENHLFQENYSPIEIAKLYGLTNYTSSTFLNFLKNV